MNIYYNQDNKIRELQDKHNKLSFIGSNVKNLTQQQKEMIAYVLAEVERELWIATATMYTDTLITEFDSVLEAEKIASNTKPH